MLKTYRAAVERKRAARALAEKLWPPVPDELVTGWKGKFAACSERETNVEGKDVWTLEADGTYHRPPRQIIQSALIEKSIANNSLYASPRSKLGKQIRKLIETAKKYEAERKTAIERSDIKAAIHGTYLAAVDIDCLAFKVREIEPVTFGPPLCCSPPAENLTCGLGIVIASKSHQEAVRFGGKAAYVSMPDCNHVSCQPSGLRRTTTARREG